MRADDRRTEAYSPSCFFGGNSVIQRLRKPAEYPSPCGATILDRRFGSPYLAGFFGPGTQRELRRDPIMWSDRIKELLASPYGVIDVPPPSPEQGSGRARLDLRIHTGSCCPTLYPNRADGILHPHGLAKDSGLRSDGASSTHWKGGHRRGGPDLAECKAGPSGVASITSPSGPRDILPPHAYEN